ncbi:autotransporter-associated beta strand repeat-containing protein [Opitutales bacterium]|nr:autotransporter-associated beta strand repeat-containing protein [Opitutales bacterium]
MGQTSRTIYWGTHVGPSSPINSGASEPNSLQKLWQLSDATGNSLSNLDGSGTGNSYSGDLVELGFFDTNNSRSSTDRSTSDYSPNTDSSNLFKGEWIALTSKTKIGRDWDNNATPAGEFYFKTKFQIFEDNDGAAQNNYSQSNFGDANALDNDDLGDSNDPNIYEARVNALFDSGTSPYIGVRFYDSTSATSGTSRYNTIMNTEWQWGNEFIRLHTDDGSGLNANLEFEFDNTSANAGSKVGTSDATINSNTDFVATVTYFDGDETINVGDSGGIGSSVFSGFDGTGRLYGGNDANVVTIHSASGNTGADAYVFDGNFSNASTGADSTDLTLIKSGTGDQILSGNINLADSDSAVASGGLNLTAGNLILKPASGKSQTVEYITGAGGLKLDNSGVDDGTIVTLGFANQTSSTFSGTVVLDGSGAAGETKIKVSNSRGDTGFAASDFGDTQTLSGVISNANGNKKLVKDGTGQLVLSGNNTFTGGVEIEDGTLVAGHANALGASNTVTITKGKLEVENGVTLAPTTITAGDSEKTMIGGRGTLNKAVTIGGGSGEIDVISPGDGISSSLSNSSSQQQVSLGDRTNAIGTFTISDTLTLESGGVYDWEISDFTGSAGTDWDLLKFDTLNFDSSSDTFTINIMGLAADGTAGAIAGGDVWGSYQTTNGFKFMEATGSGLGWTGTGNMGAAGLVSNISIESRGWSYYNSQHLNEWDVWYDGSGAFYLQYSAVPEPSTYMMVTGLLMVPGMSYVRRLRRKKKR